MGFFEKNKDNSEKYEEYNDENKTFASVLDQIYGLMDKGLYENEYTTYQNL